VPASTILLIDADAASAETISTALTGVGYTVVVSTDPDDALSKVADHHLVIIDVVSGERTGVDVCREIRATPALSSIPVLCVGQGDEVEERIRYLEAGADDVMGRPFDSRELEARVEALLLRFQRSKDIGAVVSTDGV
jgi:sigma-B regulation protein RsbU (phosphoserine phosphatase)